MLVPIVVGIRNSHFQLQLDIGKNPIRDTSIRDTEGLKQNAQRVHFCHQSKMAEPCGIQAPADLVCPGPTGVRLLQVLQPDLTSTSLVFPVGVYTHLHIPGYADLAQSEHGTCTDTSGPHTVMRSADGTSQERVPPLLLIRNEALKNGTHMPKHGHFQQLAYYCLWPIMA